MFNEYELYTLAAILCFGGAIFCLIGHYVEKYLDDSPQLKRPSVNINPHKLAEYNQTVDRR